MENSYCVYIHLFPNGKRYVGITTQKPEHRWGHKGNGYKGQKHVYNAIRKYGWDHTEHIIVLDNLTKEKACEEEKRLIEEYKTTDPAYGYNSTDGGDHYEFPDQVKQKLRKPKNLTEEQRETFREHGRKMYEKNLKGRRPTEDQIRKMAATKRGTKQSPETVAKRAAALSRHWKEHGFSEEHRKNLSKALKGRTYSPEALQHMKEAHTPENNGRSRKVGQYKNGALIKTYPSAREAMRKTGIDYTSIVRVCNGVRLKHAGGYEWKYE